MTALEIIQMFSGTVGAVCFAILFNTRGKRLIATAFGGFFSCVIFIPLSRVIENEPAIYFIVAVIISLYSEIMARRLKTPATPIATTSLIPLIPGSSLYYTMVSSFEGNFDVFLEKALNTIKIASSFALGIIIVAALSQFIFKKGTKMPSNKKASNDK